MEVDLIVNSAMLDNAVTNARRHQGPQHLRVTLAVEVTPEDNLDGPSCPPPPPKRTPDKNVIDDSHQKRVLQG